MSQQKMAKMAAKSSSSSNKSSSSSSSSSGGGNVATQNEQLFNNEAADLGLKLAYQKYLEARLEMEKDNYKNMSAAEKEQFALQAAQQQFTQAYQAASLTGSYLGQTTVQWAAQLADITGMYGGQPTMAATMQMAAITGFLNGQPTLARDSFVLSERVANHDMSIQDADLEMRKVDSWIRLSELGIDIARFNTIELGDFDLRKAQSALEEKRFTQIELEDLELRQQQFGLDEERFGFEQQQEENDVAQQLLDRIASLRGPRDAFQMSKVLQATPNGMYDILAAAAGRYNLAGFGGGDPSQLEAVTLENFIGDTLAGGGTLPPGVIPPGTGTPPGTVTPPGVVTPPGTTPPGTVPPGTPPPVTPEFPTYTPPEPGRPYTGPITPSSEINLAPSARSYTGPLTPGDQISAMPSARTGGVRPGPVVPGIPTEVPGTRPGPVVPGTPTEVPGRYDPRTTPPGSVPGTATPPDRGITTPPAAVPGAGRPGDASRGPLIPGGGQPANPLSRGTLLPGVGGAHTQPPPTMNDILRGVPGLNPAAPRGTLLPGVGGVHALPVPEEAAGRAFGDVPIVPNPNDPNAIMNSLLRRR